MLANAWIFGQVEATHKPVGLPLRVYVCEQVPFIKTDFNRWKDESDSEPEDDFSSNQDSNLQAMMQQMGGLGGQMGGLGGQMGGLGGQMGGLGGQMGGLGGQMGGLGGPMGGLGGPMGGLGGGPAGGGDLPGMDVS